MTAPLIRAAEPAASFLAGDVAVAGWPGHIAVIGPARARTSPPKDWPEGVRLVWLEPDARLLFLWFAPSEAWLPVPAPEVWLAALERLAQVKAA